MARDNTIKVKLDGNELARLDELRPRHLPRTGFRGRAKRRSLRRLARP